MGIPQPEEEEELFLLYWIPRESDWLSFLLGIPPSFHFNQFPVKEKNGKSSLLSYWTKRKGVLLGRVSVLTRSLRFQLRRERPQKVVSIFFLFPTGRKTRRKSPKWEEFPSFFFFSPGYRKEEVPVSIFFLLKRNWSGLKNEKQNLEGKD